MGGEVIQFDNDTFNLTVTSIPESWVVEWRQWLDDLDAGKTTTEQIRKQLFQMKEKK